MKRNQIPKVLLCSALVLASGLAGASAASAAPLIAAKVPAAVEGMPDPLHGDKFTIRQVNVRSGPGVEFGVKKKLEQGALVTVVRTRLGYSDEKQVVVRWSQLSSGGWIRSDYLTANLPHLTAEEGCFWGGEYVVADEFAYLMKNTDLKNNPKVGSIPEGGVAKVSEEKGSNHCGMAFVKYRNSKGKSVNGYANVASLRPVEIAEECAVYDYASKDYFHCRDSVYDSLGRWDTSKWGKATFRTSKETVLRTGPSQYAGKIITIPKGTALRLGQMDGGNPWFETTYKGYQGWVKDVFVGAYAG